MDYKIILREEWDGSDEIKIYAYAYNEDYKSFYLTIEDGLLVIHPKEVIEVAKEPILRLGRHIAAPFLRALTEGLRKFGYVAEVDNAQRLTSEAKNEERKEQIDWLRTLVEKQL